MRIIDSHAHSVAAECERYPHRRVDSGPPVATLDPDALAGQMAAAGVAAGLLVQRTQLYGLDNSMIADAAAASANLFAVCAVSAADAGCAALAAGWADRGAVGFRLMGSPLNDSLDWLTGPGALGLWRTAAERELPVCVHFFPVNRRAGLAALTSLAGAHPSVPVVVDHLSNGVADDSGIDRLLLALMDLPQAVLKVTTIPLARLKAAGRVQQVLGDYLSAFGADRLMWGSDVTQSPGSYAELVALGREAVAQLGDAERAAILGETCARVYRLGAI